MTTGMAHGWPDVDAQSPKPWPGRASHAVSVAVVRQLCLQHSAMGPPFTGLWGCVEFCLAVPEPDILA